MATVVAGVLLLMTIIRPAGPVVTSLEGLTMASWVSSAASVAAGAEWLVVTGSPVSVLGTVRSLGLKAGSGSALGAAAGLDSSCERREYRSTSPRRVV